MSDERKLLEQVALDVHEHDKRLDDFDEAEDRVTALEQSLEAERKLVRSHSDRLERLERAFEESALGTVTAEWVSSRETFEQHLVERLERVDKRLGQLEDAVDDLSGGAYALNEARAARERDELVEAFTELPPAATRARRYSADGAHREYAQRQAKLEQLVDRWRGAAERLREKDRTSQRFEKDIAEAYETCADELFALLEERT